MRWQQLTSRRISPERYAPGGAAMNESDYGLTMVSFEEARE